MTGGVEIPRSDFRELLVVTEKTGTGSLSLWLSKEVGIGGPCMSYRGRTLLINNLVSSLLWHRLAVEDLPLSLSPRSKLF